MGSGALDRRTLWRALACLLALAVAAAVLGAAVPKWRQARADAKLRSQCQTIATQSAARNRVVTGHGQRVTVLGDSYAQGYLLTNPAQSWPSRLPGRVTVNSLGGTGFVASPCGQHDTYADRAASVLATHPRLVVIEGGLNDVLADRQAVADGLRRTVAALTPVRVVVVGPADAPKWREQAKRVDQTLAAAARIAHVQYVSALQWPLSFAADGIHLTPGSHRLFGDRVAQALR